MNLSDSVIILLKKKETYYIKETSLLSLLSVKEMRQLLFYKIYEDIINSSHYLCYFFIRWVLWSFLLIKWINPYREENKSLYLAYLSNMNYPLSGSDKCFFTETLISYICYSGVLGGVTKRTNGQSYFI